MLTGFGLAVDLDLVLGQDGDERVGCTPTTAVQLREAAVSNPESHNNDGSGEMVEQTYATRPSAGSYCLTPRCIKHLCQDACVSSRNSLLTPRRFQSPQTPTHSTRERECPDRTYVHRQTIGFKGSPASLTVILTLPQRQDPLRGMLIVVDSYEERMRRADN